MRKLTKKQKRDLVEAMRSLATGAIDKLEIVGEPWTDDHILCCKMAIGPEKVEACWPWCSWEGVASVLYFSESKQARADLQEALRQELEGMTDEDIADHYSPHVLG